MILLQNQESFESKSCYIASGSTKSVKMIVMIINVFLRQGQIFIPIHWYGENVEKTFFFQTYSRPVFELTFDKVFFPNVFTIYSNDYFHTIKQDGRHAHIL